MKIQETYCDICQKYVADKTYTPADFSDTNRQILEACEIEDICGSCRDLLLNIDIKDKIKRMIQSME